MRNFFRAQVFREKNDFEKKSDLGVCYILGDIVHEFISLESHDISSFWNNTFVFTSSCMILNLTKCFWEKNRNILFETDK